MQANVAIYRSNYEDYIDVTFDAATLFADLANLGEAKIEGIEFDLDWLATEQLRLNLSGSWTEAEFTKIGSNLDPSANLVGDRLPNVPEYEFSASAEYSFNWSSDIQGAFYLAYDRQGESHLIIRSAGLAETAVNNEAFGFLTARLSADWQAFRVSLFANNLLDEDKLLNADLVKVNTQARPRTIGLGLTYNF